MNSEEIVETTDVTTAEEDCYEDDNSNASALPAVGVGLAIGAVAAIAIPKAAKGIKKLAGKAKGKISDAVATQKAKRSEKKEDDYYEIESEDED